MPGPDHASLLLKFVMPEVAECLAGLTFTCTDAGIIHFTTCDQRLDKTISDKQEIGLVADLQTRIDHCQASTKQEVRLTASALQRLESN